MKTKLYEFINYLTQKMEQEGRTVQNNRYIPRESDLTNFKSISSFEELKSIIKIAIAREYIRKVELGIDSYSLTYKGQDFALNGGEKNMCNINLNIENNGNQIVNLNSQNRDIFLQEDKKKDKNTGKSVLKSIKKVVLQLLEVFLRYMLVIL
ncbi:MAG: hypothetical protein UIH41_09145 [Treponemataceae bacterium]|nr:hypothetical protein [Treponemataceae bacterium]